MTTLREAAQQALEALEQIRTPLRINTALDAYDVSRAIAALRTALSEPASSYVDGVNVPRLMSALTKMGVACDPSQEAVAASLADHINRLTRAMQRTEPVQAPVAWANMRLDGRTPTMLSISQHPEDRANWVNPVPLYTHPVDDTALLRQAYLLCDEINKMPHVRGSINGMAVQLQYALRERLALSDAALLASKPGQLKDRGTK
jgi:hypothetical protein